MNALRAVFHLALADFYERTRQYRFLLTLAAIIILGVLVNNGTLGIDLGPGVSGVPIRYRGELNSAWIGAMTVMVTTTFLSLFGFYLVSDCIKRDIRTGVGQIIATTPVSRAAYLAGKWLSNFVVLAVLVLILAVAAVVMVLLQSESALDLGALLLPFLFVALPSMALTAALGVVFETVPWLRGAVGNVVYFFMWAFLFSLWTSTPTSLPFLIDPIGYNTFSTSIHASAWAAFPDGPIGTGLSIGNAGTVTIQYKTFTWTGVDWTPGVIAGQWSWVIIGLGLILLSALWFARFDPSREGLRRTRATLEQGTPGRQPRLRIKLPAISLPSLSPLVSKLAQLHPFLGVLFAELRLLLNRRRWWWWLVIAGLNIAILSTPLSMVKEYLLPIAWLWPLPIWSEMGNRERKNNTAQMVFSSRRPVLRQFPAAWLAGVLVTALFGIAGAVAFLMNGDLPALAGWMGAVLFIPSLALSLGVFSSGSRAFEVIYVIWWYLGPLQQTPGMDFISGAPQFYLLAAAALLLLAVFWRGRQVRV